MNESFGGDQFNSTAGAGPSAEANSEKKAEGVCPVFIKQILQAKEGNFQMFGMTFSMVTTVAIVRNIDISSTKITYTMEDHTGRIDAHYWLEEGDALKSPDVMVNNYARVFGSIRQSGDTKTLMAFKLLTVTDINEVTTHLLEVLNSRYKAEEFSQKGFDTGSSDFGSVVNKATDFGSQQENHGMDGKHLMVFEAIKKYSGEEGISRVELQKKFNTVSPVEITTIIEFMIFEGHIYTSIDADHFLAT